jgi:hypothetical protein
LVLELIANELPDYDDDSQTDSKGKDKGTTVLAEYEQYLKRELPPRVRRGLEQEVEKELNCVEDTMKTKAIEIFRNVQLQLLRTFKFGSGRSDADLSSEIHDDTSQQARQGSMPAEISNPNSLIDDPDLAALFEGRNFDFETLLNMPNPLDGCGSQTSALDSAYGTMSSAEDFSFGGSELPPSFLCRSTGLCVTYNDLA